MNTNQNISRTSVPPRRDFDCPATRTPKNSMFHASTEGMAFRSTSQADPQRTGTLCARTGIQAAAQRRARPFFSWSLRGRSLPCNPTITMLRIKRITVKQHCDCGVRGGSFWGSKSASPVEERCPRAILVRIHMSHLQNHVPLYMILEQARSEDPNFD